MLILLGPFMACGDIVLLVFSQYAHTVNKKYRIFTMGKRADNRVNVNCWVPKDVKEALDRIALASQRSRTQVLELLVKSADVRLDQLGGEADVSQLFADVLRDAKGEKPTLPED